MKIKLANGEEYDVVFAGADRGMLWIRFLTDAIDFDNGFKTFNNKKNTQTIIYGRDDDENPTTYEGYTDLALLQKEYEVSKYNVLLALRQET